MLIKSKNSIDDIQNVNANITTSYLKNEKINLLLVYSIIILAAGIIGLLLREGWYSNSNIFVKLFVYTLSSMALSFTIVFGMLDFVNLVFSNLLSYNSKSIVETQDQILLIITNCFIVGILYSIIFTFINLEYKYEGISKDFEYSQHYALPIGIIFGGIGGLINELLRDNSGRINIVLNNEDPFSRDI